MSNRTIAVRRFGGSFAMLIESMRQGSNRHSARSPAKPVSRDDAWSGQRLRRANRVDNPFRRAREPIRPTVHYMNKWDRVLLVIALAAGLGGLVLSWWR